MKQAATPILLSARGISKRFPGVQALDGVDLDVNSGEILAVVGENGAGKSTLMRILAGAERPDEGTLHIKGRPVSFRGRTPADAIRSGVALIHQELELCDNLDVAGNILLGREPRRGPFVDRHSARKEAFAALEQVGLAIDPSALLEGLGKVCQPERLRKDVLRQILEKPVHPAFGVKHFGTKCRRLEPSKPSPRRNS